MVSTQAKAIGGSVTIVVVVVVVVVPSVLLTPRTAQFRSTFMEKCEAYGESSSNCEGILNTFQQAYVGKEHCGFAEENYNQLFASYPFSHQCGKTILWSGTEDKACWYSGETGGILLGHTLLGSVLDGLEWCGEEGNKDTYIYLCKNCKPNPVTSFWGAASAKFAQYACGGVTAILDGERKEPYYPGSTFASVEVPNLKYPKVTHLQVILVTKNNGGCSCDSLGSLKGDLDYRIGCSCQKLARSHVKKCMEQNKSLDDCLRSALN